MTKPGFCHCGCGGETTTADWTDKKGRHKNGEPRKYLKGHYAKHMSQLTPDYTIDENGCWIWAKGIRHSYGTVNRKRREGRSSMAHVYYWEEVNGLAPEGMDIHHTCENKLCVNPDHLTPMTRKDHIWEHIAKGTWGGGGQRKHPIT